MTEQAEIKKVMILSTAHISFSTSVWLQTTLGFGEDAEVVGGGYGCYGWFLYCHDEQDGIPDDLFAVMTYAEKHGCWYLLLDRDAETTSELPVFDW